MKYSILALLWFWILPSLPARACKMTPLGGSAAQLQAILDRVAKTDKWRDWKIVAMTFKEGNIVATLKNFGPKTCYDVHYTVLSAPDCSQTITEVKRKKTNCT